MDSGLDPAVDYYRNALYPQYDKFARRVRELVSDLLSSASIDAAQLDHRAKDPDHLAEKLRRKKYVAPLDEVTDLAGVRIVTYYADDAARVSELIRREFDPQDEDSSDKLEELDVNEFGYRSVHVVCRLSPMRRELPEWKMFADFRVEFQIRSVLQHAWAAISHQLDYKSAAEAPVELRRRLFRLSALTELADQEFASLRDRAAELRAEYVLNVPMGALSFDINYESLWTYFTERVDLKSWEDVGLAAGLDPPAPLPDEFETTVRFLADLFQSIGWRTLNDVDTALLTLWPDVPAYLAKARSVAKHHHATLEAFPLDIVLYAVVAAYGRSIPKTLELPKTWKKSILQTVRAIAAAAT